jgi:hypothetical protein
LQKFPKRYADKVRGKISHTKLLQQAGNAMTSSVIEEIAKSFMKAIGENMTQKEILVNNGRETANMLQFKINPAELVDRKRDSK